jgi:hypothetical protein
MKFKITLKDPDGVYDSIEDAVEGSLFNLELDENEKAAVKDTRLENINDIVSQWIEYREYLTVEIDTEARTCVVVPVKE